MIDAQDFIEVRQQADEETGIEFTHLGKTRIGQFGAIEGLDTVEFGGKQIHQAYRASVCTVQFGADPTPKQNDIITINGVDYRVHSQVAIPNPVLPFITFEVRQKP